MTSPDAGFAAALAGLPAMGPHRLTALIDRFGAGEAWVLATSGPRAALADVLQIEPEPLRTLSRSWQSVAATVDPAGVLSAHAEAGVRILLRGDADYPDVLREDIEPPAVLFSRGDLACLDGPRVAIVGTRRCTGTGAGLARELGRDLAAAGVVVVSGLALGIDGAAHRGVFDAGSTALASARPVGVVGSGLDVVYPSRHRDLWARVAQEGLLLSESPLGSRPAPWRFPARNRVIAALADIVVVVESHVRGGSLHTVAEAIRRDIDVLAAPGSVRSASAAGTNQLLAEGCHPVRDSGDVLVALGLTAASQRGPVDRRPAPDITGTAVLEAFDWEPATLEHLAVRTALPLGQLAVALERLVTGGWVLAEGGWYERVAL